MNNGLMRRVERLEELTVTCLASSSGQPKEKVRSDLRGELSLDAYAAKSYGLIDDIIRK